MRIAGFFLIGVCAVWPVLGVAQNTSEIEKIADTMVRLCVGGGRTETSSATGAGEVDLSLRSLDAKGNLKGEFKINKSRAEGLINGLDNALSQVAVDQADKVRTCLQPVRERLLDVMLPKKRAEADIEISDVAVTYEENLTILDVKMRNTGDSVAVVNIIGVSVENKERFTDCNNPRYSLMPISAKYEIDITKKAEEKISHEIKPNETERIKLRVVASEAGAVFIGAKAKVIAKYNKENIITSSNPFSLKAYGLVQILGMFTPGSTKEKWEECTNDNRKRFCSIGMRVYEDDPPDICSKYGG